jgi:hypothetical protein
MNSLIKVFFIALTVVALPTNAEVITVNFKSVVDWTSKPNIAVVGETIDISLTYDTSTSFDGMFYFDQSEGSTITATFQDGFVLKTNPSALNKVEMNHVCPRIAVNPDIYTYSTVFMSNDSISNVSPSTQNYSLALEVDSTVDVDLWYVLRNRATWDSDISNYSRKSFNIYASDGWIQSTITDISVAPASPITVKATTSSAPISALGGSLNVSSDVENTSLHTVKTKRWAYIIWPDGTHYNHNAPVEITLDSMVPDIQTSNSFIVPPYWPAGTYEYQLNTIVEDGDYKGAVSHGSFSFIKQ